MNPMKFKKITAFVAGMALLTSCEYQKYNQAESIDVRANSEYVYGVHPDSAAVQLSNKYEEQPELELRTNAIRDKMFGDTTSAFARQ
jgi:rhodanese-related sulfurtransferase